MRQCRSRQTQNLDCFSARRAREDQLSCSVSPNYFEDRTPPPRPIPNGLGRDPSTLLGYKRSLYLGEHLRLIVCRRNREALTTKNRTRGTRTISCRTTTSEALRDN